PLRWSSALARSSARNRAAVWMPFSSRAWWIVTSTTPPSVSAIPTTRTAAIVMRTRTVPSRRMSTAGRVEPVPRAADRLHGAPLERLVDLLAEVPHVDLHDVRVTVEGEVPHVVEDLGLRDDLPDPPDEELEHRELARGEGDVDVPPGTAVPRRVEHEVAGGVL